MGPIPPGRDRAASARLAPAFEVTWAYGGAWARTHQMTARGKDDHFTRADLLEVGSGFDVPHHGADILEDVEASLDRWASEAKAAGVEPARIGAIQALFRHFA